MDQHELDYVTDCYGEENVYNYYIENPIYIHFADNEHFDSGLHARLIEGRGNSIQWYFKYDTKIIRHGKEDNIEQAVDAIEKAVFEFTSKIKNTLNARYEHGSA